MIGGNLGGAVQMLKVMNQQGGGQSWEKYWATRFPSALYAAAISNTSIYLSWTNNGTADYTGHKVYISTDNITFTLNKTIASIGTNTTLTGLTADTHYWIKVSAYKGNSISGYTNVNDDVTFPDIVMDGNSVAIIFGHDISAITKDASNRVSQINDRGGSGNNFAQAGADALKPLWNMVEGFRFDGVNDFIRTADITFNQPAYYYLVLKQQTWTGNDRILDAGPSAGASVMFEQNLATPGIRSYAGSYSTANANLILHRYAIVRFFANGAGSKLQINATTAVTTNIGTNNPGGVSLGAARTGTGAWSCVEIKGGFIRKIIEEAANETIIYNNLIAKFFTGRNVNMVWEGHSMINLLEIAGDICVTDYTENKLLLKYGIKLRHSCNVAIGGATIANIVTRYAASVTANKDATGGVKNYLTIFIGANDIDGTEGSGIAAYNALHTYIDTAIADGWIPIIITMLKKGTDADVETQRLIFNNALKANSDFNYIVDVDSIPELLDPTNITYFNADQLHLISAGNEKLANALSVKIKESIDDNT